MMASDPSRPTTDRSQRIAEFAPRVRGFLRRLCRGSQETEDRLQSVLERAPRYRDSFDPAAGEIEPWLMKIAWIRRFLAVNRKHRLSQVQIECTVLKMSTKIFEAPIKPLLDASDRIVRDPKPETQSIRGNSGPMVNTSNATPLIHNRYARLRNGDSLVTIQTQLAATKSVATLVMPRVLTLPLSRTTIHTGRQVSYIKDFEVEVGKPNVVHGNPVIGVVRDGMLLTCDTAILERGTVGIGFDFQISELVLPIPTFTTTIGVGNKVTIQLPQVKTARIASRIELSEG